MVDPEEVDKLKRAIAVEAALKAVRSRSFSGRHPELGKMIKCPICNRRHRSSIVCKAVYAKDKNGQPMMASQRTRRGVYGAKAFDKQRFHLHPNKNNLQLVQRTQELYPQHEPYLGQDPQACMESAREQATEQLTEKRRKARRAARRRAQFSRRINLGLLPPGSRP